MVNVRRSRLGPARVECLIVIKENLLKGKEFKNYLDDYDVPEKPTTNPYEKVVANATERKVSEEEVEFNSDYSYDYDTDSSNEE